MSEETLETKKDKLDFGRRFGNKIVEYFGSKTSHKNIADETTSLLQSESSSSLDEELAVAQRQQAAKSQDAPPIRDAFSPQSSVNLLVYCILSLHSITFDQLLPVLMAYPPEDPSQRQLPLKFAGGFGMSASQVGSFFSVFGAVGMILQILVFPPVTTRLGPLRCLRFSSLAFPIVYALVPFVVILPQDKQQPALFALMFIKTFSVIFAFPCSTILLTNSSPTLRLLGTLNGIAVTLSAMGRAIGPATGGLMFSRGQEIGYLILPWWILALVTFLGALPITFLVEGEGFANDKREVIEEEEEVDQCQDSLK
ncbi:hypothetical protein Q9L58_006322 [Maublancomyces gigas]|uniref:Major facilitator superfamily (MFS) profile domain-containing protein n=1 Tax=Discina gigas TaxID=1032678 RepID=A0ABR3GFU7_9PEZI